MPRLPRPLLTRTTLPPAGAVALWLAAVGVGIAGFLHGRLFHQGYSHVEWVGPLFLLNAIGSGATILLLVDRRPLPFVLGAFGISVGSVVSIVISHSTSFLGFAEHRYDGRATTIVVAEIAAAVLVLIGAALSRGRLIGREDTR